MKQTTKQWQSIAKDFDSRSQDDGGGAHPARADVAYCVREVINSMLILAHDPIQRRDRELAKLTEKLEGVVSEIVTYVNSRSE